LNLTASFSALFSYSGLITLIILSFLEVALGIDNIIFISLVVTKLPVEKRFKVRAWGLLLAFIQRIIILAIILWLTSFTTTVFSIYGFNASIRDLFYFTGGLYLLINTGIELWGNSSRKPLRNKNHSSDINIRAVLFQIVFVDLLFSFDSIFAALGLIRNLLIISTAIALGMIFMLFVSGKTSDFIDKYPLIKAIALSFILIIAAMLVTSGLHFEIPRVYCFTAIPLGAAVEGIRSRRGGNVNSF
jgi:predicted tellurium resistance membrane protein TerC